MKYAAAGVIFAVFVVVVVVVVVVAAVVVVGFCVVAAGAWVVAAPAAAAAVVVGLVVVLVVVVVVVGLVVVLVVVVVATPEPGLLPEAGNTLKSLSIDEPRIGDRPKKSAASGPASWHRIGCLFAVLGGLTLKFGLSLCGLIAYRSPFGAETPSKRTQKGILKSSGTLSGP